MTPTSDERERIAGAGPIRVQLQRTRGWRMPANTVVVSRPSKWGNPFDWQEARDEWDCTEFEAKAAVALIYRDWLTMREPERFHPDLRGRRVAILGSFADLRGKNLGCWCGPGDACHADVLLELANAPAERNACSVAVDDRTQAASEASDPPTRDGADKPVEGEGG